MARRVTRRIMVPHRTIHKMSPLRAPSVIRRIGGSNENVFSRHDFAWFVHATLDTDIVGAGRTAHGTVAG